MSKKGSVICIKYFFEKLQKQSSFNNGLNNCCEDTVFGVLNLEGSRSSSCDLV